jgi:hypothetical protein
VLINYEVMTALIGVSNCVFSSVMNIIGHRKVLLSAKVWIQLTSWSRVFEKLILLCYSKNSPNLMEPNSSLQYAQQPSNEKWNLWTLHVCDSICFQTLMFCTRFLSVQYSNIIEVISVNIQSQNNWINFHWNVCITL